MRSLPRGAAAYVCAVIAAAAVTFAVAASRTHSGWLTLVFLAVLYWIGDCTRAVTRLRSLAISLTLPIALATILLLAPSAAVVVCTVASLAAKHRAAWFKRAFNSAQVGLSVLCAGAMYEITPDHGAVGFAGAEFPLVLPSVVVAGLAYCVANCVLVGVVVSLTTRASLSRVWWSGFSETAIPNLGYGLLGLMVAVLWAGGVGPVAALLVLVPMLIARWAFQQYGEQHKAYEATVATLIRAVETKDSYTRGHSERVAKASVMLAEKLGMREDRLQMLRYAGMLHDVGKLGVPTKLLQKTGPLDDDEFAAIRLHPGRGVEMINEISFLDEALRGIRHHHERVDGRGYPDGLAGDQIPQFARIIAVADAFDSMTSTRSYRSARTVESAIAELRNWAGTQFDAAMVEALIAAVEARGWEPNIAITQEPAGEAGAAVRDHDDPTTDLAAGVSSHSYSLRAEVS